MTSGPEYVGIYLNTVKIKVILRGKKKKYSLIVDYYFLFWEKYFIINDLDIDRISLPQFLFLILCVKVPITALCVSNNIYIH